MDSPFGSLTPNGAKLSSPTLGSPALGLALPTAALTKTPTNGSLGIDGVSSLSPLPAPGKSEANDIPHERSRRGAAAAATAFPHQPHNVQSSSASAVLPSGGSGSPPAEADGEGDDPDDDDAMADDDDEDEDVGTTNSKGGSSCHQCEC